MIIRLNFHSGSINSPPLTLCSCYPLSVWRKSLASDVLIRRCCGYFCFIMYLNYYKVVTDQKQPSIRKTSDQFRGLGWEVWNQDSKILYHQNNCNSATWWHLVIYCFTPLSFMVPLIDLFFDGWVTAYVIFPALRSKRMDGRYHLTGDISILLGINLFWSIP